MSRKRKNSKTSSTKKKTKLSPNRFQQTPQKDPNGVFSFDPIRRDLLMKGVMIGTAGAIFMVLPAIVFQVIGVLIVVLISNYYIGQAAKQIPR